MSTTIYSPQTVLVSDTPYKSAALVSSAAAMGDDSDATYADQWYSVRGNVGTGPTLRAFFDPLSGYGIEQMRMRFEVFNDTGGTGTNTVVSVFSVETGLLVGNFRRPGAVDAIIEVPALNTIYDYDDWEMEQVSLDESVNTALSTGLLVTARRNPFVGTSVTPLESDGDYCLRVYELQFRVSPIGGFPPRRILPRSDGATGGARRILGGVL